MITMEFSELLECRIKISNEISKIGVMRRGTLNEFYHTSTRKDRTVRNTALFITYRGEYGKTVSKSVPQKDIDRIREEAANCRKFRQLSDEYADVCEKITYLLKCCEKMKNLGRQENKSSHFSEAASIHGIITVANVANTRDQKTIY